MKFEVCLLFVALLVTNAFGLSLRNSQESLLEQMKQRGSQCNLSYAGLNVGDVIIELPGKVGFFQMSTFAAKARNNTLIKYLTARYGPQMIMPLDEISEMLEGFLKFMPPNSPGRGPLENFYGFINTERGGTVTCHVQANPSGTSIQAWRPYNLTLGWHYFTYTDCNSQGWSGFGADDSVMLSIQNKGPISWTQQSSPPGAAEFISISSRSQYVGNLQGEPLRKCCYPASNEKRDCSAVTNMIASFPLN